MLAKYDQEGVTVVQCFPGSFKPIWTREQSGETPTEADNLAWEDYNIGIKTGDSNFCVILFPGESVLQDAEKEYPELINLTSVLNPDGTVAVWFRDSLSDGRHNSYIAKYEAKYICRGWVAPAPPSTIGSSSCKFIKEYDPIVQDYSPNIAWQPMKSRPSNLQAIPLRGYMAFSPEEKPDLIGGGLLDSGGKAILAGVPKVGKSRAILNCALSLVTGKKFLELDTNSMTRVLFIQFEVSERRFRKRVNSIARAWRIPPDNDLPLFLVTMPHLRLDTVEGAIELRKMIRATKPDVVILDPMSKIHARDESDQQEIQVVLNVLDDCIDEFDVSFILVHHLRKASDQHDYAKIRGSGAIAGWVDSMLIMERQQGKGPIVIKGILRNGEDFTRIVVINDNHTMAILGKESQQLEIYIVDHMWENMNVTRKQLAAASAAAFGMDITLVYKTMEDMESRGLTLPPTK